MSTVQEQLSPAQTELVELAARLAQRLGLTRSTGQIYGLLFVSPRPLSLDDIAERLALSKTSASTGSRQLASLNLIRQVWLPGERRDHFEVRADLREVLRANYNTMVKPRLDLVDRSLARVREQLGADAEAGRVDAEARTVTEGRLRRLEELHKTLKRLLPLAEKLL